MEYRESYEERRRRQLRENRTIKDFHAKLDELYAERDEIAGVVSGLSGDITSAKSQIETLKKEQIGLLDNISILKDALQNTEKILNIKNARVLELSKNYGQIDNSKDIVATELKRLSKEFPQITTEIRKKREDVKKLQNKKSKLEIRISALELEKKQFKIDIQKKKKQIEKERKDLVKERISIEEIHKQNSKLYTNTQNDLRKLEHYVKRLQRYYDQHKIKLSILKEFNIKQDA